ncbi:hypothetical protein ACH5RR_029623 [Cinchona calisaya]|uniref:Uncharacterized protein n=1 Tax=Cinchona calisaya TaxID=153742 RepID=A0ABD2YS88_9GENT
MILQSKNLIEVDVQVALKSTTQAETSGLSLLEKDDIPSLPLAIKTPSGVFEDKTLAIYMEKTKPKLPPMMKNAVMECSNAQNQENSMNAASTPLHEGIPQNPNSQVAVGMENLVSSAPNDLVGDSLIGVKDYKLVEAAIVKPGLFWSYIITLTHEKCF